MSDYKPQDAKPARSTPPLREWRCVGCGKTFEPGPLQAMPDRCRRCDGNLFEVGGLFPGEGTRK